MLLHGLGRAISVPEYWPQLPSWQRTFKAEMCAEARRVPMADDERGGRPTDWPVQIGDVRSGGWLKKAPVNGLGSMSPRYEFRSQYDLRNYHFGAAEERYREGHVGDARQGRSVHHLRVAHNIDAAPNGG